MAVSDIQQFRTPIYLVHSWNYPSPHGLCTEFPEGNTQKWWQIQPPSSVHISESDRNIVQHKIHTGKSVCYYFRFIIALPMGRLTKRKCYRSPKRASWTLELSLPQINLFKVVLKSLKLLMESRTSLPSPRILRVPCRWAFPIWNNSTREAYHLTL